MPKRTAEEAFRSRSHQRTQPNKVTTPKPDHNHKPSPRTPANPQNFRDKAAKLLTTRQQLPIWPHADEIKSKVRANDVVVLVGETGSGKSTQIPQFLYEEKWCQPSKASKKLGGRIAIIQPRRVAAIALATRVAQEVGTPLGNASPSSSVGYSVRFDNNVSPGTRIKFLTDGMLLQELLRDQWLKEYSCVIVDEVHERGVNVDLVLGFLRKILDASKKGGEEDGRKGTPLKVVVMSATADMEGIQEFFAKPESIEQEQQECDGFSDKEVKNAQKNRGSQKSISVSSCYIKGRQYPVTISYTPQPVTNILDTAMDRIIQIHQHSPLPGDILVFLSGQEMIENLESLCHTYASSLNQQPPTSNTTKSKLTATAPKLPSLQILPLFASLPTHLQSRIFHPTPPFTRRIILATNIAETSITVPGIRHVIDTGKHKSRLFRPGLNLDTLLSSAISQSMAKQRAGRAGREAPGFAYRLYTERDFAQLAKDTTPEILSTDLQFLVLTLKAHGVDDVVGFPLLTRPGERALERALEGLLGLDALEEETGTISMVGKKMAGLPVRPDLARCLLEGTRWGGEVMDGVVDVVSALSLEEGVWLPVRGKGVVAKSSKGRGVEELLLGGKRGQGKGEEGAEDSDEEVSPVEAARRQLLTRHSDHITLLNAIRAYSSPTTHDRRAWCDAHGVSHRAMSRIMDVRKQLRQMMSNPRFQLPTIDDVQSLLNPDGTAGELAKRDAALKCLVAGLWTNVAILTSMAPNRPAQQMAQNPNQRAPYTTLLTNQPIHIHPSSVLFTQRGVTGPGRREDNGTSGSGNGKSPIPATNNMPKAIIFTDLIYTSKPYARNASAIDLSWVTEMGKIG